MPNSRTIAHPIAIRPTINMMSAIGPDTHAREPADVAEPKEPGSGADDVAVVIVFVMIGCVPTARRG